MRKTSDSEECESAHSLLQDGDKQGWAIPIISVTVSNELIHAAPD